MWAILEAIEYTGFFVCMWCSPASITKFCGSLTPYSTPVTALSILKVCLESSQRLQWEGKIVKEKLEGERRHLKYPSPRVDMRSYSSPVPMNGTRDWSQTPLVYRQWHRYYPAQWYSAQATKSVSTLNTHLRPLGETLSRRGRAGLLPMIENRSCNRSSGAVTRGWSCLQRKKSSAYDVAPQASERAPNEKGLPG